ncbi:MAG: TatD family hydrolase [Anaerolineales bacterium]
MLLTDTHCHLDFHKFDEDRTAVIKRAERAGLVRILIPAISVTSSLSAIKLAESHPMLYAAIGVQPNESLTWDNASISALRELSTNPNIVAIGEIGLDYYWEAAPHNHQQRVFREQLELATELEFPVVIHLRDKDDAADGACYEDAMNILAEWVAGLGPEKEALRKNPGVLHSFSGSLETAQQAISLNFGIGITGPVTFKNAVRKQEMVAQLPLDHLLIETDAPYLTPHPHRGKRNEPAFVSEIADKIAQLQSRNQEEVASITTNNATRLFSWGEVV